MKTLKLTGTWLRKHRKMIIMFIIFLFVVLAAIFIFKRSRGHNSPKVSQVQINTVELSKMDLTNSVSATGTIESANVKTVSANVSNLEVKSVKVEEGDEVKKGQILLTFDKSDLQDALEEAQENLENAETQAENELKQAKRQLKNARDTYNTQKETLAESVKNAKKNIQSAKETVASVKKQVKAADEMEMEQLESQLEQAESALEQAKSSYQQALREQKNTNRQNKSSVQNAKDAVSTTESNNEKTIREAEKKVDSAKQDLKNCTVKASMAGTITGVGAASGDIYNGGDLFEISDCTDLQISTTVSEYDITEVEKGQRVVILTDATDEDEIEGEITYVAKTSGSSSLSSGNNTSAASGSSSGYTVRIKISDKDERLLVGMTAKCSIILEETSDVFAVPYDAIHTNKDGDSIIYVLDSSQNAADSLNHSDNEEDSGANDFKNGDSSKQEGSSDDTSDRRSGKGDIPSDGETADTVMSEQKEIVVTKGMESDYYVEISGDDLTEGMQVVIPSDSTSSGSSEQKDSTDALSGFTGGMGGGGMNKGGMNGGGGMGGSAPSGGGPGM